MKTYDEAEYANNRLKESIVRLKNGTPIHIQNIRSEREVIYNELTLDSDRKVCKLEDLDINPVPLGYCNVKTYCLYLVRMPMRQDWKQGLRSNSLRDVHGRRVDTRYEHLVDTIVGKFPSFKDSISRILEKSKNPFKLEGQSTKSIAFNRDFCLKEENLLEYKGVFIVGTFNKNGGYDLKERFGWVEDCLKLAI